MFNFINNFNFTNFIPIINITLPFIFFGVIDKITRKIIKWNENENENDKNVYEISSRIYSSIHAGTVGIASILFLTIPSIPIERWSYVSSFTIGYALYDSILLIKTKSSSYKQYLLHHIVMGYLSSIWRINPSMAILGFTSELSTPFLNFGWILWYKNKKRNGGYNRIIKINSIIMLLLYFTTRIVNFTYINFILYKHNQNVLPFTIFITLLNYFWFYKLMNLCICEKIKDKR
jgi:hypothetical protein